MSDTVAPLSKLEQVAAACGPFLHSRQEWIHRRVQRISFTRSGMMRTDVSIDFSIPEGFPVFDDLGNGYALYFIPLLLLRKWPPLLRLDLRDEHSEPIPLLTTGKNQAVDAAFLAASAPDGVIAEAVAPLLREIPFADERRAGELRDSIVTAVADDVDMMSEYERERWAETLRLGASLGSNMLFWARVEVRVAARSVVKVSYEQPPGVARETSAEPPHTNLRRFAASLSWAPMRLAYVSHDVGGCTACHIQLEPPDGLEVHRARLQLVSNEGAMQQGADHPHRETHGLTDLLWSIKNTAQARWWHFRHGPRGEYGTHKGWPEQGEPYELVIDRGAYMYVTGVTKKHVGVAEIDLAASRTGLRRAAVLFSLATTAFLAAMTIVASGVAEHLDGAVPALLITPALLAFVVSNPGEHPLVRQHLTGVRLVLGLVAILPVAATVSLLSFHKPMDVSALQVCWLAITALSCVLTAVLGLSWLLPPVKDPADQLGGNHQLSGHEGGS